MTDTGKILNELKALGDRAADEDLRDRQFIGKTVQLADAQKDVLADVLDRVEELESRRNEPVLTPGGGRGGDTPHTKAFRAWLRQPTDPRRIGELRDVEAKAVSTVTDSAGGFAVPEQIASMIEKLELELSPVRRLVRVMRVSTPDFKHLVSTRGAAAGWVGEEGTRSETATSELRERAPTHGEIYAYPKATEWSLNDVFFNVDNWLAEEAADAFADNEGQAVIDGNGTNKPTGLLNTQPVLTNDAASPLRDAGAFEYVAHDASAALSPPSGTAQITSDGLLDMLFTLNSRYRSNASWIMNSNTAGEVRKLKDDQGRFLWTDGLQLGQPPSLLGHRVELWEQMPDIALNAFPIAIGDWRRAYLLIDIGPGLRITRDEITQPGHVKFYIRRRVGGIVLNNDAAKFGRTIG